MMNYADLTNDTPRLVVKYQIAQKANPDGIVKVPDSEQFEWGLLGTIPLLSLLGAITRVQAELFLRSPYDCPEQALVIAWDSQRRRCEWWTNADVPAEPICGMLETIKATIVATNMARRAAAEQRPILGPDGQPIQR